VRLVTHLTPVPVPAPLDVRRLLEGLLGRVVEVTPAPPWAPLQPGQGTLALFVDDDSRIRAVAVCDVALSAHAGASIGLLPADQSRRAVAESALPEMVRENLHEVLDILSALFNVEGAPHLRLYAVHHAGEDVAPELLVLGGVLGRRLDLTVRISGYGAGHLGLVVVV
jgi:hypothetical protein